MQRGEVATTFLFAGVQMNSFVTSKNIYFFPENEVNEAWSWFGGDNDRRFKQ